MHNTKRDKPINPIPGSIQGQLRKVLNKPLAEFTSQDLIFLKDQVIDLHEMLESSIIRQVDELERNIRHKNELSTIMQQIPANEKLLNDIKLIHKGLLRKHSNPVAL